MVVTTDVFFQIDPVLTFIDHLNSSQPVNALTPVSTAYEKPKPINLIHMKQKIVKNDTCCDFRETVKLAAAQRAGQTLEKEHDQVT